MGEPSSGHAELFIYEWTHRELKHLSTCGKEINLEITLVVASEQGTAQTL